MRRLKALVAGVRRRDAVLLHRIALPGNSPPSDRFRSDVDEQLCRRTGELFPIGICAELAGMFSSGCRAIDPSNENTLLGRAPQRGAIAASRAFLHR